jgi:hypothetical protein
MPIKIEIEQRQLYLFKECGRCVSHRSANRDRAVDLAAWTASYSTSERRRKFTEELKRSGAAESGGAKFPFVNSEVGSSFFARNSTL